jgi:uncharacterized protein YndB with AHSA1/START domain
MTYELRIDRLYDASPEEVFDAFVDPDAAEEIFAGPPDSQAKLLECELDLRVGGTWRMLFGQPDGSRFRLTYVFTELERPRLLSALFSMEYGGRVEDSTVSLIFEDQDGKTLLTVVQDGFETEEVRDSYLGGAPHFFDRLQRVVAARSAPGNR